MGHRPSLTMDFPIMANFRATLAYDGTDFFGWQTQPHRRTVQETVEKVISSVTQEKPVRCVASGRTDTGVHALGQVIHFHSNTRLALPILRRAIQAMLPEDVSLLDLQSVPDDFDANRHALRKRYRYVIQDGSVPDLFQRRYSHHCRYSLDVAAMARAGGCLVGTHDFRCFETEWPNRASSVRTIYHLTVNRFGDWIWIEVEANGFLYNMVRAITGTLINIGRGYWPESYMEQLLTSGDRDKAGPTAPARGLFLVRVTYA